MRNVVFWAKFSAQLAAQYVLQFVDEAKVVLNVHLDDVGLNRRHQQLIFSVAVVLMFNVWRVSPIVAFTDEQCEVPKMFLFSTMLAQLQPLTLGRINVGVFVGFRFEHIFNSSM